MEEGITGPISCSEAVADPAQGADQSAEDADEEETEEEVYLPATGQGCYSLQISLLQRATQTFSKRSLADKYGQVAKWLLTGRAMAISRKSWHLLSKHRTCTITPRQLLSVHFLHGYLSTEQEDAKKPHAAAYVKSLHEHTWETLVTRVISWGYNEATNQFRTAASEKIDFDFTIDQTNPVETPPEVGQKIRIQAPAFSHQ